MRGKRGQFRLAGALLASWLLCAGAPAAAQNLRELVFFNDCDRPVRVLVHHAAEERAWTPHAWWTFQPRERSYLAWEERRLMHLDNHDLYFYAEATDGSRLVWDGRDAMAEWNGVQYPLRRATPAVIEGNLQIRLTCGPAG